MAILRADGGLADGRGQCPRHHETTDPGGPPLRAPAAVPTPPWPRRTADGSTGPASPPPAPRRPSCSSIPPTAELVIPLTVRHAEPAAHPGEVSLPGGAVETDDASLEDTRRCVRPTRRSAWRPHRSGPSAGSTRSGSRSRTSSWSRSLAVADERPHFTLRLEEVAELIELPLDRLLAEMASPRRRSPCPGVVLRTGVYRWAGHRCGALPRGPCRCSGRPSAALETVALAARRALVGPVPDHEGRQSNCRRSRTARRARPGREPPAAEGGLSSHSTTMTIAPGRRMKGLARSGGRWQPPRPW